MKQALDEIFVFGASGHAKVIIDIIEKQGLFKIACLADDDATLKDSDMFGYRIIGGKAELLASGIRKGIVAIGSNNGRTKVASWLRDKGFELVTAIHPSAQLGRGVTMGGNCAVMAGAVINSDSCIGHDVIVNTKASIDHDCLIGDGVHIAPGATLCGTVHIDAGSFVCAGATVIPNLTVGRDVIVGAGSTVINDIPDNVLAVGSPAKVVKSLSRAAATPN